MITFGRANLSPGTQTFQPSPPEGRNLSDLFPDQGFFDDFSMLKEYLEPGFSCDSIPDEYKAQALCFAAEKGRLEIVQPLLLEANPITPEEKGRALVAAATYGHLEIVELLLQEVSLPGRYKDWALAMAISNRHSVIVRILQKEIALCPWCSVQ